nr:hypothetical transcript [Hymenolepis microstoma]
MPFIASVYGTRAYLMINVQWVSCGESADEINPYEILKIFGFETSCLVTFLQHSTEGSAEVLVRPDKEDFSYWSESDNWKTSPNHELCNPSYHN